MRIVFMVMVVAFLAVATLISDDLTLVSGVVVGLIVALCSATRRRLGGSRLLSPR